VIFPKVTVNDVIDSVLFNDTGRINEKLNREYGSVFMRVKGKRTRAKRMKLEKDKRKIYDISSLKRILKELV